MAPKVASHNYKKGGTPGHLIPISSDLAGSRTVRGTAPLPCSSSTLCPRCQFLRFFRPGYLLWWYVIYVVALGQTRGCRYLRTAVQFPQLSNDRVFLRGVGTGPRNSQFRSSRHRLFHYPQPFMQCHSGGPKFESLGRAHSPDLK